MFESKLAEQYPFLTEYFASIFEKDTNRMPQSILFWGQDIQAQYNIAKEIARLLNCSENRTENCECLNCRWIRDNSHPSVLTVSNIDSKAENDDSKTVISIKQTHMIKSLLSLNSDFYRVFIMCGAKIENNNWVPTALNFENFKAEAANSLLKIVEETPEKALFIFLANSPSDIISTIVSRSQVFFVPSLNKTGLNNSGVSEIFEDYPNYEPSKLFIYSDMFQKALGASDKIFDRCQNYLLSVLKSGYSKQRVFEDIKIFERAKSMYQKGIKPELIADDLFLALMRK